MKKRFLLVIAILLVFVLGSSITAFAMNTGFETESTSAGKVKELQADIRLITKEPKQETFSCFSVNENGMIAIAFRKMHDTIKVRVYDKNGNFQYGYNTDFQQGVDIEWDGNNLLLYLSRSSYAISVNEKGEVQEVRRILDTMDNNSYMYDLAKSQYDIDTDRYTAKGPLGVVSELTESYSQIVVTDAEGKETVIYNASSNWIKSALIIILVIAAIGVVVLVGVIKMAKRISANSALNYDNAQNNNNKQ